MPTLFTQTNYQPKNKSVLKLINEFESKYFDVFKKIRDQWLPQIREFLRDETGLQMNRKVKGVKIHKDTSISFEFATDREETFIKLIDQHYPNLDFEEYSAFNKLQKQVKESTNFFKSGFNKPIEEFHTVNHYLEIYFEVYNLNHLMNTLFKNAGSTADIWGTYTFRSSKVEIYYVPLILFCHINNLPLEHAILSTLVHEMAHAYHHIGKDKDNNLWSTMSETDLEIVEGMAEYFTWLFVEEYKNYHPGMEKTYNAMFACLGDEYTCFKKWTPAYSKEAIKSALLSTRRKEIKDYKEFEKLLGDIKKVMHK